MTTTILLFDLEDLRRKWGWFLVLGITMIVFGTIALSIIPAATIGTVMVLGWLIVLSGIMEAIHGFRVRRWGGVFLHLIAGILGVLIGLLIVTHPVAGALAWTLLFASFFTIIGLFQLVAAMRLKFPNWGWAVFDGVVTLLLGILLWAEWPWSGYWFVPHCQASASRNDGKLPVPGITVKAWQELPELFFERRDLGQFERRLQQLGESSMEDPA